MEKREIIILSVTLLAAAYGAADFLIFSKEVPPPTSFSASNDVNLITTQLAALSNASNNEVTVLSEKLQQPWPKAAFFDQDPEDLEAKEAITNDDASPAINIDLSSFSYSGFLQMNTDKIAIINGKDYKMGDSIGPYTVGMITDDKIFLTQDDRTFEVPIKKID